MFIFFFVVVDGMGVFVEGVVVSGSGCGVVVDDFCGFFEWLIDGVDEVMLSV